MRCKHRVVDSPEEEGEGRKKGGRRGRDGGGKRGEMVEERGERWWRKEGRDGGGKRGEMVEERGGQWHYSKVNITMHHGVFQA